MGDEYVPESFLHHRYDVDVLRHHGNFGFDRRDVVVAQKPRHFLDDVYFALHVHPESRNPERETVLGKADNLEMKALENLRHLAGIGRYAEKAADLPDRKGNFPGAGGRGVRVDRSLGDRSSRETADEFRGPIEGERNVARVHAFFEPARGFALEPYSPGGLPYPLRGEAGRLEQNVGRRVVYFGFAAAHDARESHGLVAAAYEKILGEKLSFHAIEGRYGFSVRGLSDRDVPFAKLVVVESVKGLALFEHDEVRYVHHVVHRPDSRGLEPFPQPLGGGSDAHPLDEPAAVPGTGFGVENLDPHPARNALSLLREGKLRLFHVLSQYRRNLPGDAEHAQAVGPVGGHAEFQNHAFVT